MAEVGVTELRRHLKAYLDHVSEGGELIITDRGTPVARITGIDVKPMLERLVEDGILTRATQHPRPVLSSDTRVKAKGSVSDYIVAERDSRRP